MKTMKLAIPSLVALAVALAYGPAQAQVPILGPDLATFAVLGASTVTNVSAGTAITGNVGVWDTPTGANDVTGLLAGQVTGTIFEGAALATSTQALAQLQLDAAILSLNNAGLVGTPITLSSGDLSTLGPIAPGNYIVPNAAFNITGALTLDGTGSSANIWIFHFPKTTLITSTTSTVNVIGVADGNVGIYWDVGSSATLNGPTFQGYVLAGANISTDGALSMGCGGLFAATEAVNLRGEASRIRTGDCDSFPGATPPIPEPEVYAMMAAGLGLMGWVARRRKQKAA